MDKILKLVNKGNADEFLDDPEIREKLNILVVKNMVKISEKQVVFTEEGILAYKIGFQEYEKLMEKKDYRVEPVSDKAVVYFLKNWNRKRIIGFSTWILLLILWALLKFS